MELFMEKLSGLRIYSSAVQTNFRLPNYKTTRLREALQISY